MQMTAVKINFLKMTAIELLVNQFEYPITNFLNSQLCEQLWVLNSFENLPKL